MQVTGKTDIGKIRSQNQDTIYVSAEPVGSLPNLFIVADGMGGHNAGEIASNQAVAHFCEYIRQDGDVPYTDGFLDLMVSAAAYANRQIIAQSMTDPSLFGMGTTFTACVVQGVKCEIIHIGDSRVYMVTQERITQLTIDHSYVNEMVRAGQLTPSEAREHPKRNILTRVMGLDIDMSVDGYVRGLEEGCAILLCSDGLTNMLTDDEIRFIINQEEKPSDRSVETLIHMANKHGGMDNISVILIDTR